MSIERTCKNCGEEFDARHNGCPACGHGTDVNLCEECDGDLRTCGHQPKVREPAEVVLARIKEKMKLKKKKTPTKEAPAKRGPGQRSSRGKSTRAVAPSDLLEHALPALLVGVPGPLKCTKKAWCHVMAKMLPQDSGARLKGLDTFQIWHLPTMTLKFVGVLYREKAGDPGVTLTYCPWCRTRILPASYQQRSKEVESRGKKK